MKHIGVLTAIALFSASALCAGAAASPATRTITLREYRDRMTAGWIGQMAGVAWGGPTEFRWQDKIIPEDKMPAWTPDLINSAFGQDDLYVEMTFLRTLEKHGLRVSIRQAGIDFANSEYALWCANMAGRNNLRLGIAPPDSSHPQFNKCPNDIDYQIEADYSGLIAPGLPQAAIALGEKFGRLMNYGDGMYAGQFMGAMYAAAFFETDRERVVEEALKAIPRDSQYAEMVRDVLAWYRADRTDWQATWQKIQRKYREDPEYQKASNGGIDCKINGAYVVLGLLYGEGDPDRTIIISTRAGMDSDCNPSSSAGVLFTMLGMDRVPERFISALNRESVFSHTAYSFPQLIDVCEKLARQVVRKYGGKVARDAEGNEVLVVPVREPVPSALELSWAPGPIADSKYTAAEKRRIKTGDINQSVTKAAAKVAPGWKVRSCGPDMGPGLLDEWRGRKTVLLTHPFDPSTPCVLERTVAVPRGKRTTLRLAVSHYPDGDWLLRVVADGKTILERTVGAQSAPDGWLTVTADLTEFTGKRVKLELHNMPTAWAFEAGYWNEIAIVTE